MHITQGDHEGRAVIVSWVTMDEPGSKKAMYWKENSKEKKFATGKINKYKYYNYTSGYIHHCTIKHLEVGFSLTHLFTISIVKFGAVLSIMCNGHSCVF